MEALLKTYQTMKTHNNTTDILVKLCQRSEELNQQIKELEKVNPNVFHIATNEEVEFDLYDNYQKLENEKEILDRMRKLEQGNQEKLQLRAKEIVSLAIQKCAVPQSQELTTTTVVLANEELKGRIIGKEKFIQREHNKQQRKDNKKEFNDLKVAKENQKERDDDVLFKHQKVISRFLSTHKHGQLINE